MPRLLRSQGGDIVLCTRSGLAGGRLDGGEERRDGGRRLIGAETSADRFVWQPGPAGHIGFNVGREVGAPDRTPRLNSVRQCYRTTTVPIIPG